MALKFPPDGHPVLAIVTREDIEALTPDTLGDLPTIADARKEARRQYQAGELANAPQLGVATTYNAVIRTTDGCVVLAAVWPNGSLKVRWNFGRVEGAPAFLKVPPEITETATTIVEAGFHGRLTRSIE